MDFFGKVMSLLFNMLSRFVTAVLPRSKHLFISWLQSPSAVILEPKKIKSVTVSIFSPSICHEMMELKAMILIFWMLSFKPNFHSLSFSSRASLVPLHFLPLGWCHRHIWGFWYFSGSLVSSLAFYMMYSAWKLNTQGGSREPCLTPFPVLNQSSVPCAVLLFLDPHRGFSRNL